MRPDLSGLVFYQVFVRSFFDADGDGVGDIRGLTQKLDYLTDDLGVNAIWLMPIFDAKTHHGYDTLDYYAINPAYGTNRDFVELLEAAHRRKL
ncbi:MAG: alpha amylase catalytic region, partial [Candidatus Krumholzibacteriota bacterium]|nr:alpha amylase catalytic region [Candidatus Krumholzibacteriota bacterium]